MDTSDSLDVELNFEPQTRARSNTWPLPRDAYFGGEKDDDKISVPATIDEQCGGGGEASGAEPGAGGGGDRALFASDGGNGTQPPKKNSSRRNAWGNKSYAELITQAISSAPDNRLTLAQIYDYMIQNVEFFKDKGDSNSSAGWKNSIRHNLSLHNRFMRIQNEGTGKSSWWVINPDAKPGKAPRRRAVSMETKQYERKRGRLKKRVENIRTMRKTMSTTRSPDSPVEAEDKFPDSPLHQAFQLSPDFRPRASSNASSCSRLSPISACMEGDGGDSQVPPLSPLPWNSGGGSRPRASTGGPLGTLFRSALKSGKISHSLSGSTGTLVDRYGTDQLGDSLAETMKLGGDDSPFGNAHLTSINGNGAFSLSGGSVSFNNPRFPRRNGVGLNGMSAAVAVANDFGSPYQPSSARNSPSSINVQTPPCQASPQGSGSLMDSGNGSFLSSVSPQHSVSPGLEAANVLQAVSGNGGASQQNGLNVVFGPAPPYHHDCPTSPGGAATVLSMPLSPEVVMLQQQHHLQQGATLRAALCEATGSLRDLGPSASVSLGSTAQLMGQLFSLPNDVDLNTIQEGLECDVDQVIRHELSVEGNLDFNFEHQNAAAAAAISVASSVPHPTTMASNVVNRPWVH